MQPSLSGKHDPWFHLSDFDSDVFSPYRDLIRSICEFSDWPQIADYNKIFSSADVHFVPQTRGLVRSSRSRNRRDNRKLKTYNELISSEGVVPTRERNRHDFFNALIWHFFPQSKKTLHQLGSQYSQERDNPLVRSPKEDFLTIFDEGGMISEKISINSESCSYIFGHAILEEHAKGCFNSRPLILEVSYEEPVEKFDLKMLDKKLSIALVCHYG